MLPRLVTYKTAAGLLSVSLSTLKRMLTARELEPVVVGGLKRIAVEDIDALVASARTHDSKEPAC